MPKRRVNTIEPKWILVFVFFASGVFFGGLATYLYAYSSSSSATIKQHLPTSVYKYTNPTLTSDPTIQSNFSNVSGDLRLRISGIVSEAERKGLVQNVGLYFRDLEPAKVLAINANTLFSPGKLLKVPIMIAYYKLADQNPAILKKAIVVPPGAPHSEDIFGSVTSLSAGSYTVDELIDNMISSNNDQAALVLFDNIDKSALNEVFSDLGIDFNEDRTSQDFISIRRYSIFLRVLYNASYLSAESSEKALTLLDENASQSSLLQVNLPNSIDIANRVGGRKIVLDGGVPGVEVYECDIVYYQSHHYLLCASAQAEKLSGIRSFFASVGDAIYSDMKYQYGS